MIKTDYYSLGSHEGEEVIKNVLSQGMLLEDCDNKEYKFRELRQITQHLKARQRICLKMNAVN